MKRFTKKLNALLQGESFLTYIDTGVIYPQVKSNPSSVYSFLLVAGYLNVIKSEPSLQRGFHVRGCPAEQGDHIRI